MTSPAHERGGIFFYILLGCMLFAVLAYAITQSVRLSDTPEERSFGTSEKLDLYVSDIQQFLESLKMRVFDMETTASIVETELDFKNDVYLLSNGTEITDNVNAACVRNDCHVFAPYNPQGITPLIFLNAADSPDQSNVTLPKNGHGRIRQIAIKGVGSAAPDLVFVIHGIAPHICNRYNEKVGITTTYTSGTTLSALGESSTTSQPDSFTGTYNSTHDFGNSATQFSGKKTFCAPAYGDAENHRLAIWYVLKAR